MSMHKNERYGRLVVLEFHGSSKVKCICDCGSIGFYRSRDLRKGKTKSCGCLRREKPNSLKHGFSSEKLYVVHKAIKQRCFNPKNKDFPNYGGRGITLCVEWNDYISFRKWSLLNGYQEGLKIDRIDNDQGYFPENCRWVNQTVQSNNTRTNRLMTYKGETKSVSEWVNLLGLNYRTVLARLNRGWSDERALTEQVKNSRSKK